ncbi:MAG: DUF6879 family protein [Streptomycetales bacterium]
MPAGAQWPEGLPEALDFWLIDDRDVWAMEYDGRGQLLALELIADLATSSSTGSCGTRRLRRLSLLTTTTRRRAHSAVSTDPSDPSERHIGHTPPASPTKARQPTPRIP